MRRLRTWYPAVAFVLAIIVLMPSALAGRSTYVAVDLQEATSPFRDDLDRAPDVVSPTQTDQVEQTPPVMRFMDELRHGRIQLWEPRVGMGTPTSSTFPWLTSPFNVVYLVVPAWYAVSLDVALTLLVGQLLMFLFLRRLGTSRGAATFGAVAYAFTGTNLVFVQRPLSAVWILPGLLWAISRMMDRQTVARGLTVGAFVAWCWFEGFPSVFAYSAFTAIAWAVWLAVRQYRRDPDGDGVLAKGRRALVPLVLTGVGFAWGGVLAMITLLPFVDEVNRRHLLDLRTTDLHSHLPAFYAWSLFDLRVNGNPLNPGSVWGGVNPYESVTMIGSIVLVGGLIGLVLALRGRQRVTRRGRDAWAFFAVLAPVITFLSFVGTRVLGWVVSIPGIASNPFHRSRFLIALAFTVLATLAFDQLLGRRGERGAGEELDDADERAPRRTALVVLAGWVAIGIVTGSDFFTEVRRAGKGTSIEQGMVIGAAFAAAALLAVWAVRRGRLPATAGALVLTALVFAQVGYPLRDYTPEAPVADFFRSTPGHDVLRELGEGRYRFAATTFNYYPGSASVLDLYDVRGLVLYDTELRHLLETANPKVFSRDPLKQQLFPDEVHLESAVYDHLALRHFVLATAEVPYGVPVDPQPDGSRWQPLPPQGVTVDVAVPAERELAGAALRLRSGDGCEGAQLTLELLQRGEVLDTATKPAADATGDWTALALTGGHLAPGSAQVRLSAPERCRVEVGTSAAGRPALRSILDDPSDAVELVATEEGWIYERPTAWPIVSVHTGWSWHADQDALLAALRPVRAGTSDVVPLVGSGTDVAGSGTATVVRSHIGTDDVTAVVQTDAEAVVVLSQDFSEGWEVTVDGRAATLESVDGALMGVRVPAGTHDVAFRYRPKTVRLGTGLTALALIGVPPALWLEDRRRRRGALPSPATP